LKEFIHSDLVQIAQRWLRKTRHGVVLAETITRKSDESPDAIGWRNGGSITTVIECKTSRADFLQDAKKSFRERGMGNLRYFLAPVGLIPLDQLPKGWGLLEVKGRTVTQVVPCNWRPLAVKERVLEMGFLYSELRRFHILANGEQLSESRSGKRCTKLFEMFNQFGDSWMDIPEDIENNEDL
jgi:hypothetical protein